jgi:YesN/AraC family two-component response regulator
LQIIEKETDGFDAIITDIVMPNISGVGVISIVKKKFPDICIIAITGWGEHPEALAIKAQADRVLRKPFELAEFEKIITDLIAEKHAGNDEAS